MHVNDNSPSRRRFVTSAALLPMLSALPHWVQAGAAGVGADALSLWYDQPAGPWLEALPLGNGRLGAMVFGRPPLPPPLTTPV